MKGEVGFRAYLVSCRGELSRGQYERWRGKETGGEAHLEERSKPCLRAL